MTTPSDLPKQDAAQKDLESFGYQQQLKRTLSFWQLTAFGLNYMIPIAPALVFGFILNASGGSVVIPYLLAGIIMLSTANSYGILIRKFPIAGSLYSYVSRSINPHIGFLAGWVLLLDYLLLPTVTSMSVAVYLHAYFPSLPYAMTLLLFLASTGLLNLLGVDLMARFGLWMLIIGEIVIFIGFGVWSYAVGAQGVGVGHLLSLVPFHFQSLSTLASATAIAVLSYLGFDAITTLSEEAIHPKRDIPNAIIYAVILGGITMCLTGYLGMLVIPEWSQWTHNHADLTMILFYVAELTGGKWFVIFYTSFFLLAMAVFNVVATAAAARLLFGMGRDEVLPKKYFGAINQRWRTPHWNIIAITLLQFILGVLVSINAVYELVSYGALCGFILVNFSIIWLSWIKPKESKENSNFFHNFLLPIISIFIMIWVFLNLKKITLIAGSVWLLIGVIYGLYQSKGYRKLPSIFHR